MLDLPPAVKQDQETLMKPLKRTAVFQLALLSICLLMFSALIWGAWTGYVLKHNPPASRWGQIEVKLLKLASLAIVLTIGIGIAPLTYDLAEYMQLRLLTLADSAANHSARYYYDVAAIVLRETVKTSESSSIQTQLANPPECPPKRRLRL